MIVGATLEKNITWIQGNSRGILYSFFSAVFNNEVKMENAREFMKEENINRLKDTFSLLPEEKSGPLLKWIDTLTAEWENRCGQHGLEAENLELRKEFAYLFLTPKGVYPFESVYQGKKNLLMDKPWEEVKGFYRRIGLEKEKSQMHPEDHAAVELGLMASLAFLSGRKLPDGAVSEITEDEYSYALQVQRVFLRQHLLAWVPRLCKDIMEKTRHPFYRAIAELTALFIKADGQMLQDLPDSNLIISEDEGRKNLASR